MRRLIGISMVGIFLLWPVAARAADQCVGCHTDAAKLKVLVRPAAEIAAEEGAS